MATYSPEVADPACRQQDRSNEFSEQASLAAIVLEGLSASPKRLPPWLFYDEAGSRLFDEITRLPEYYLTRTERAIFAEYAGEMIGAAAENHCLRVLELGSGSADKTRTLLAAVAAQQATVCYQPVDVSASALDAARERLEREMPSVSVEPLVADYTRGFALEPCAPGERRLALFIGSSIGNFEPEDALVLLSGLRDALDPEDTLLLGVDLSPAAAGKSEEMLVAAYDDAAGVTAQFNLNLLARLNRDLGAGFDLAHFAHVARWNEAESRMEMHIESLRPQSVAIQALNMDFDFAEGETIHTENSYKYRDGEAETLLRAAGFDPVQQWNDANGWFSVLLGRRR
jgi:dimethylhistidine N-methyltransferase